MRAIKRVVEHDPLVIVAQDPRPRREQALLGPRLEHRARAVGAGAAARPAPPAVDGARAADLHPDAPNCSPLVLPHRNRT